MSKSLFRNLKPASAQAQVEPVEPETVHAPQPQLQETVEALDPLVVVTTMISNCDQRRLQRARTENMTIVEQQTIDGSWRRFTVRSASGENEYVVEISPGVESCSCPDLAARCKHMLFCALLMRDELVGNDAL